MKYKMIVERYRRENGKWELYDTVEYDDYTIEKWENHILGSRDFFKRLGGTEVLQGNTLTSISPHGNKKSVYKLRRKA